MGLMVNERKTKYISVSVTQKGRQTQTTNSELESRR